MTSYSAIQAAWKQFGGDKKKMGQWVDENRVSDQDLADALGYGKDEVATWLTEADRQRRAEPRFGPGGTSLNLGSEQSGTAYIPTSLARLGHNLLPGGVEERIRAAGGSVSKPPQGEEADPYWTPTFSIPGMTKQQATDWLISQPEFYSTGEFTQEDVRAAEAGNITPGYANAREIAVSRGNADSNNAWYDKLFKTIAQYGGIALAGGTYAGLLEGGGAGAADAAWGVNALGEGVAGDYSLAELANIAGSAEGATGLTAASLAEAGVPLNIINQGASAVSKFLKDNKDTISLIGTGAGLAGIAGSLISGDNKTTTTTTTKDGGGGGDGSLAGVGKSEVDDAIKWLIQSQMYAIARNKELSGELGKSLKDQIAGMSKYYGNAQSKYDPSKNVLSAGGGGTGGTSYVGGAGLSEKASAALDEIMGIQLANLKNAGKLTPEQSAMIDANTGLALQTGQSDIAKFTKDTLRQINEEISQASGLRPTDTPIVRLSERAGEEASRQQGQLVRTLAGANVQSKLDYPLKASANTGALAASASSTNEALRSFQADLEQRAENNRYRLFGQPVQDPYANNAAGNLGLSLAQLQLGQAPTTQTQTQSLGLNDYVNAASGIGALIKSLYLMNP